MLEAVITHDYVTLLCNEVIFLLVLKIRHTPSTYSNAVKREAHVITQMEAFLKMAKFETGGLLRNI